MSPTSVPVELNPVQTAAVLQQLGAWIISVSTPEAGQWFQLQLQTIREGQQRRDVYKALGLAARKMGKADLALDAAALARAAELRPGWDPSGWSVDQAARVALLLASRAAQGAIHPAVAGELAHLDAAAASTADAHFVELLEEFAASAEINELIALYQGLPLFPAARALEPRAREAIRSAMRPVFEAMAHRNPYPQEQFDQDAWNQMVVKTFFLDSPLWPIQGLEARGNPALARILVDLAHERWAAGRTISLELWRCVGPHADAAGVVAMQRVLDTGSEVEQLAIALALANKTEKTKPDTPTSDNCAALRAQCVARGLTARALEAGWRKLVAQ